MRLLLFNFLLLGFLSLNAQGSIPITISTDIFYGNQDESIHLKITDSITSQVWYDTVATVSLSNGFMDTVYLDSSIYKCEVIDIGANVNMPKIELNNGSYAQWGYPDYEYYLIDFSVGSPQPNNLNTVPAPSEITPFPNPVKDVFTICIPDAFNQGAVSILDVSGRTMFTKNLNGQNIVKFNSSDLPNGVYTVVIKTKDQVKTSQLLKTGN